MQPGFAPFRQRMKRLYSLARECSFTGERPTTETILALETRLMSSKGQHRPLDPTACEAMVGGGRKACLPTSADNLLRRSQRRSHGNAFHQCLFERFPLDEKDKSHRIAAGQILCL